MTTVLDPVVESVDYAPTVQDRIQKILYRLDHGEELTHRVLYNGDNFCVLGLFADESGMGNWDLLSNTRDKDYYVYAPYDGKYPRVVSILPSEIKSYYNLKSVVGSFSIKDLPDDLQSEIRTQINNIGLKFPELFDSSSLANLNDILLFNEYQHTNDLLAAIIRSGAIFNS